MYHKMADALGATAIGVMTAGSMAVVSVDGINVSLGVAVPCMVFVSGIVWWLSSRFQRIADGQSESHRNQQQISERLSKIEMALRNCPAQKNGDCNL